VAQCRITGLRFILHGQRDAAGAEQEAAQGETRQSPAKAGRDNGG